MISLDLRLKPTNMCYRLSILLLGLSDHLNQRKNNRQHRRSNCKSSNQQRARLRTCVYEKCQCLDREQLILQRRCDRSTKFIHFYFNLYIIYTMFFSTELSKLVLRGIVVRCWGNPRQKVLSDSSSKEITSRYTRPQTIQVTNAYILYLDH